MNDDHEKMKETWAKVAAACAARSRDYFIEALRKMQIERGHGQSAASKVDAGNAVTKAQQGARERDPRPSEEIVREQRDEWTDR